MSHTHVLLVVGCDASGDANVDVDESVAALAEAASLCSDGRLRIEHCATAALELARAQSVDALVALSPDALQRVRELSDDASCQHPLPVLNSSTPLIGDDIDATDPNVIAPSHLKQTPKPTKNHKN